MVIITPAEAAAFARMPRREQKRTLSRWTADGCWQFVDENGLPLLGFDRNARKDPNEKPFEMTAEILRAIEEPSDGPSLTLDDILDEITKSAVCDEESPRREVPRTSSVAVE